MSEENERMFRHCPTCEGKGWLKARQRSRDGKHSNYVDVVCPGCGGSGEEKLLETIVDFDVGTIGHFEKYGG